MYLTLADASMKKKLTDSSGKRKTHLPFYDAWRDFTPDENRLHETYEGEKRLLPELDIVGWLLFSRALKNALHPSRHKNFYEILYMEHGLVDWWVEDSSYAFNAGQVLIIRPNELHGASCAVMQPCGHYWVRFAFPKNEALPGLSLDVTRDLQNTFLNLHSRLITCSDWVKKGFRQLIHIHRLPHSRISEAAARATFHTILCHIALDALTEHRKHAKNVPLSPRIQAILRTIQENLEEPPQAKQLAHQAHMSESAFRSQFELETGVTLSNYINIQRIREAKELLKNGGSVTDVAFETGFSSSQYFATVFKRWAGLSPSEYLKQIAARKQRQS